MISVVSTHKGTEWEETNLHDSGSCDYKGLASSDLSQENSVITWVQFLQSSLHSGVDRWVNGVELPEREFSGVCQRKIAANLEGAIIDL